jgi:hypothetical protein
LPTPAPAELAFKPVFEALEPKPAQAGSIAERRIEIVEVTRNEEE